MLALAMLCFGSICQAHSISFSGMTQLIDLSVPTPFPNYFGVTAIGTGFDGEIVFDAPLWDGHSAARISNEFLNATVTYAFVGPTIGMKGALGIGMFLAVYDSGGSLVAFQGGKDYSAWDWSIDGLNYWGQGSHFGPILSAGVLTSITVDGVQAIVPEPSSLIPLLLATGLLHLRWLVRKRSGRKAENAGHAHPEVFGSQLAKR